MDIGPTVYYRFGESAGPTLVDEAGNHNGTYYSSPIFQQTSLLGGEPNDDCVDFNNAPYALVPAHTDFDLAGNYSFVFWTKAHAQATDYREFCMSFSGGAFKGWAIFEKSTHKYGLWTYASEVVSNSVIVDNGQIHMVAIIYTLSDGKVRFYLDGSPDGEQSVTLQSNPTAPLYIARHTAGGNFANGWLDEMALFKGKTLTATQIANL